MRETKPLFEELTVERSKRITALLYGVQKMGKTTLAASSLFVPEMRDVLILDAERSRDAVSHFQAEDGTRLKFMPVNGFDDLAKVTDAFRRNIEEVQGIKTVIVDTLSAIKQNYLVEQAMGDRGSSKTEHRTELSDFMKVTIVISNFINALMAHDDLNIILISHQREMDSGMVRPNLNDALRQAVEQNMSEMWYLHMNERTGDRVLEVLPVRSNSYVTVGARNPVFRENLERYAMAHAPEGQDAESWKGKLLVPSDNNIMRVLYDLHGENNA